jgi:glutathione S-transferase
MDADLELIQFPYSHYNEKVRWALDYKGLAHRRTDLLPGPHRGVVRKLTGKTQTPVLRLNRQYVGGSTQIIERLELIFTEAPPLYPTDPQTRTLALELARHFDFVVGPAARIVCFAAMLDTPDYVARLFSQTQPWLARTAYRAVFPFTKRLIRRANGITDGDAIAEAERLLAQNMDSLAKLTYKSRYLAGDAFSVADLTAAALLAPVIDPPHPDMKKPEPMPPRLAELTVKWRDHAAGRWVLDIYDQHRRGESHAASCAIKPS